MGRAAVVLLSGGLDSAVCLAWAKREGFAAHALTIDYGQRHAIEVGRARDLARSIGAASHRVVSIDLSFLSGSALTDVTVPVPKSRDDHEIAEGIPATYVPGRNTVFLALAMAWGEALAARDLVLGVNAIDFSGYPDCRPAFVAAFEALAREGTRPEGGPWRIHAPLIDLSKGEIAKLALSMGVPVGITLSCYDPSPDGRPCGSCDACRLRAKGFREAGLADPALLR